MKGPLTKDYLLHKGKANKLDQICSLDLSHHSLTSIDGNQFSELTSLKTLDLSGNHLDGIPGELRLKKLRVLDCCDNNLQSVRFIAQMKGLKELYMEGNSKFTDQDCYIAKALCPTLQRIDADTGMEHITAGIDLYKSQLGPQIKAVWEATFAEVYSQGISTEEIDKLHQEFVTTVTRSGVVGSNLTMPKLKDVMIERLCKELLYSVNSGTYSSGRRQKSDKYSTRVSLGSTPVKDYRTLNSGEKKTPEKSSKPSTPKQSTNKRKREVTPTASPAAKRRRQEDDDVPTTKRKREATPTISPAAKEDVVAYSPIKVTEGNRAQLPPVDNFESLYALRCHSQNNDPSDHNTKVWKCAFEPKLGKSGESTILATCGGNIVCFIDCQTGKVMKRYKDTHKKESFYSLAWTTLRADGDNLRDDVNILAVAGEDCSIKLIHPRQLAMFGALEGHKGYVSSLVFHPQKPHVLFSGSRDNKIIKWEIGVPDFKDNSIEWSKKAVLSLPRTDAISMVVDPHLNVLVAGCELSCYGWDLDRLNGGDKKRRVPAVSPHYEFVHPLDDVDDKNEVVVDGLVMLSNHCIVSKCVGHSCLFVWDLRASIGGIKKKATCVQVSVQPLAQLLYTPVDIDYLYPHARSNVLCVGDDEGRVHMYDLKSVVKKRRKIDHILEASSIIEGPELMVEKKYENSMADLKSKEDAVVNCVALSPSQEYLAYGTDNNLVFILKNASKL